MEKGFENFDLSGELLEGINAMGFNTPTPIQERVIPDILGGKDIIACAQTGTGKTGAYIIPLLEKLKENNSESVKAIVLVPTRELAQQIDQQLEGFSYFTPISSISLVGGGDGVSWDHQKRALLTGVDVVIATPGRLIAHLNMGYTKLEGLKYFILDEADRMLDMGFFKDIERIEKHLPKRQTLMFSATMPGNIKNLAKKILHEPEEIYLAVSKPAENILQAVYDVSDNKKLGLLASLLNGKELESAIIFASTKKKVRELEEALANKKFIAKAIHSDLEQSEREKVLLDFRNRKFNVLIATDIISRGIDIQGLEMVLNYDVPKDPEDYIHRVGRTARANSSGVALTFADKKEKHHIQKIEKLIGSKLFRIKH